MIGPSDMQRNLLVFARIVEGELHRRHLNRDSLGIGHNRYAAMKKGVR